MKNNSPGWQLRLKKVVLWTAFFLFLGLAYAVFVHFTHLSIPCIFHAITGLQCPGCGMTRAMMALLHGEPIRALQYNYFFIPIWGMLAAIYLQTVRHYVRTGRYVLSCGNTIVDRTLCVLVLAWWVVRNILGV